MNFNHNIVTCFVNNNNVHNALSVTNGLFLFRNCKIYLSFFKQVSFGQADFETILLSDGFSTSMKVFTGKIQLRANRRVGKLCNRQEQYQK